MIIFNFLTEYGYVFVFVCMLLLLLLASKMTRLSEMTEKVKKLEKTVAELDEQAKLIVQSDLQFTKTQEALDQEIESLQALNKLNHLLSSTLDEKEIFNRFDSSLILRLGFEKLLVAITDKNKIATRVNVGFMSNQSNISRECLEKLQQEVINNLQPLCIAKVSDANQNLKEIMQSLKLKSLVVVPMVSNESLKGILVAANKTGSIPLANDDLELFSILANQITQSLENIKLYEEAWGARQNLEATIKERTKELSQALEQVRSISKAKSEFISAVSHELRTPLTSIKGYATILSSGKLGKIPAAAKHRLKKINKNSDSLINLINELLDIARIESGRTSMKPENFKLNTIANSLADMLSPQAKNNNINLTVDIDEDISLCADKTQIERALMNLLSNSLKFTPQNGTISLKAQQTNNTVKIEVSDSGKGISRDNLPLIFNQFYRVDNETNSQVKGTGLGLSLVKSIIEAHNGTINCESEINQGTSFFINLPKEQG